jgi:hypothetical protein
MVIKIIKIVKCEDCDDFSPAGFFSPPHCKQTGRIIRDDFYGSFGQYYNRLHTHYIPNWCPLPGVDEEGEK